MSKLIYCATPSRIVKSNKGMITQIMDLVTNQGYGPLHPFQALPYERYEGGPVGRDKSMEFCLRLVDISDELWMFGISNGTLMEVVRAQGREKPVELKFEGFDPQWKEFYEQLGAEFGNPLDKMLAEMGLSK
ncbi:MAG TPA: hypothetical protein HA362_06690 [Nanoarchaeota archaeon]|nr:hypothetical protein [Nanoarchaeota archaeon]